MRRGGASVGTHPPKQPFSPTESISVIGRAAIILEHCLWAGNPEDNPTHCNSQGRSYQIMPHRGQTDNENIHKSKSICFSGQTEYLCAGVDCIHSHRILLSLIFPYSSLLSFSSIRKKEIFLEIHRSVLELKEGFLSSLA